MFIVLLKITKMGNMSVRYENTMADQKSKEFLKFSDTVKEGITAAYRNSNAQDHFLAENVNGVMPATDSESHFKAVTNQEDSNEGVIVNLTVQISRSVNSALFEQEFVRSLTLSAGRFADPYLLMAPISQSVTDFDECSDVKYNDCSVRATCTNTEGTFTCKCNEKFEDTDLKLPGRTCSEKRVNCEYCHNRGDCLENDYHEIHCRCLPMYVGKRCEINGLVLAVVLPSALTVMVILVCVLLCCCRKCRLKGTLVGGDPSTEMFSGIVLKGPVGGKLDKKAMIDTSSESSGEHARMSYQPFDTYQENGDITSTKDSKRSDLSLNRSLSTGYVVSPVLIPRAKSSAEGSSNIGKPVNYTVYNGQVYMF